MVFISSLRLNKHAFVFPTGQKKISKHRNCHVHLSCHLRVDAAHTSPTASQLWGNEGYKCHNHWLAPRSQGEGVHYNTVQHSTVRYNTIQNQQFAARRLKDWSPERMPCEQDLQNCINPTKTGKEVSSQYWENALESAGLWRLVGGEPVQRSCSRPMWTPWDLQAPATCVLGHPVMGSSGEGLQAGIIFFKKNSLKECQKTT